MADPGEVTPSKPEADLSISAGSVSNINQAKGQQEKKSDLRSSQVQLATSVQWTDMDSVLGSFEILVTLPQSDPHSISACSKLL